MSDESTLLRIEAMLVSLRDQVDHLTERVDARLADQQQQLARLRRELGRLQPRDVRTPRLITKPDAVRRGGNRAAAEQ